MPLADGLGRKLSGDKRVILGMASDPEPEHAIGDVNSKRPIVEADAGRPQSVNLLEVE
jgi:hypothetical protein